MTQAYSNPERENDVHALPDVEVFYHDEHDNEPGTCWEVEDSVLPDDGIADGGEPYTEEELNAINYLPNGWYWWTCLPGCLPDGDAIGPFNTEEEALQDAQDIF